MPDTQHGRVRALVEWAVDAARQHGIATNNIGKYAEERVDIAVSMMEIIRAAADAHDADLALVLDYLLRARTTDAERTYPPHIEAAIRLRGAMEKGAKNDDA